MQKWLGFQKGINLGGWLSQCVHTKEHYDSFICAEDISIIAADGYDHIRLPIDYNLVQDKQGSFIESGFGYIDSCISWCEQNGLNMVLDLHKTAGYSFDDGEHEAGFFYDDRLIEQFLTLWEELARRYGGYSFIAFELLNEVVEEKDNAPWMAIAERAVAKIRKHTADTKILLGSYMNNHVCTVKHIALPFDENIVYNFHCYDPLVFTHQGAYWVKKMPSDFRMSYPVSYADIVEKAQSIGLGWTLDIQPSEKLFGTEFFEDIFAEAIEVAEQRGVMLYCGEYGVIDLADDPSRRAWLKDIREVFARHGIGNAVWSYRKMDFGLYE